MGQNLFTDFAPILFKIIQNFGVNDFEPYLHLPHLVTCSMAALTLPVFQLCWEAETTAISGALVAVHFFQASRIQTWDDRLETVPLTHRPWQPGGQVSRVCYPSFTRVSNKNSYQRKDSQSLHIQTEFCYR